MADHSKETCKNWFFKIASIRELLPRIYMEMAIISSYRFIENDCFPKVFERCALIISTPTCSFSWPSACCA